jgi:hypothetical protein
MKVVASIVLRGDDDRTREIASEQPDMTHARSWIANQRVRFGEYPDGLMINATIERLREGHSSLFAEPVYTWSTFDSEDSGFDD